MTRPLIAMGLAAAMLAAPMSTRAQDQTDVLTGRITDDTGRPVAQAEVEVVSLLTEIVRRTFTDLDGKYVLLFPDGGGQYQMTVRAIGLEERTFLVSREGVEEVLITQVSLAVEGVELQGFDVNARRLPPGSGNAGTRAIVLPQRLLDRLPLPDFDPALLAALSPNVILTAGDTASDLSAFSVAGQRDALNQITLDGGSLTSVLGQGGAGNLPEEGVRATRVVTSTYDVSRGQFSGGLIAMTSARGVNRTGGSTSYNLQDPSLASGNGAFLGGGTSQHRVSGGVGGPIVPNKLFYNVSFSGQRRSDAMFALVPENQLDVLPLGANPDSIARFLSILGSGYGIGLDGQTGPYDRIGDGLNVMGRFDLEWSERHSVMLRLNGSASGQDNGMVSPTELIQNGGEMTSGGYGVQLGVTSRLGGAWINQLRATINGGNTERSPFVTMPEGRVELGSVVGDPATSGGFRGRGAGGVGFSTLVFGGDGSTPSFSEERTVEFSDELSLLLGFTHRLKVGGLFKSTSYAQESGANTLGRFIFPSLAALEAQQPASFTRTLAPQRSGASTRAGALYVGDTWRPSDPFQVTLGVRGEWTTFRTNALRDPGIEAAFGRRTDVLPSDWHMSPRIGFSYRLSERGTPLRQITGGIGDFRGQAPLTLFGGTLGNLSAQARLQCIGAAVPTPDWDLYRQDLASVPDACVGGVQTLEALSSPSVDLISPDFSAPRSWRATLGYQAQVGGRFTASAELMYTRGVSLYGVRDLNLDTSGATALAGEGGRLFFGDPATIVASTGEVSLGSSRIDPSFGHVFETYSGQESSTTQATLSFGGLVRNGTILQANYTLTRSTDESSFSSGRPSQGFSQTTTGGNPNLTAWAPSDFERRHALTAYVVHPMANWIDLSLIGRLNSGAPFTPMVARDVNGDGARNDAAFIFDPATTADATIAASMTTVLQNVPDRIRDCLQRQLGKLAQRNSCREGWQGSLDVSATLRPDLPWLAIGQRLSVQVDVQNALAGLDHLIHSDQDLRGWGVTNRSDRTLLRPVGYDALEERFAYSVNERFGQSVGGGGRRGFGGGGGFGGMRGGGGLPGGGLGGRLGGIGRRGGLQGPDGAIDVETLVQRVLANPVAVLLELADTLGLSEAQIARIEDISADLEGRIAATIVQVQERLEAAGGEPQAQVGVLREVQPLLQEGREAIGDAMERIEDVLTNEQWDRVPEALKNPVGRGFRGEK